MLEDATLPRILSSCASKPSNWWWHQGHLLLLRPPKNNEHHRDLRHSRALHVKQCIKLRGSSSHLQSKAFLLWGFEFFWALDDLHPRRSRTNCLDGTSITTTNCYWKVNNSPTNLLKVPCKKQFGHIMIIIVIIIILQTVKLLPSCIISPSCLWSKWCPFLAMSDAPNFQVGCCWGLTRPGAAWGGGLRRPTTMRAPSFKMVSDTLWSFTSHVMDCAHICAQNNAQPIGGFCQPYTGVVGSMVEALGPKKCW